MKKIYNAPYFKVVAIKNDIIATSNVGVDPDGNNVSNLAPGRGMWDEDFDTEDLY